MSTALHAALPADSPLQRLVMSAAWPENAPRRTPNLAPGIAHSSFSVQGDARQSFAVWQERMSPVYDLRPIAARSDDPFDAALSRYTIDDLSLFEFHTGPNEAVRSLGRVSTESIRDISFSVYLEGQPGQFCSARTRAAPRSGPTPPPGVPAILALDMDQPCTVRSFQSRILLLFVPRAIVEQSFPDAASLHGRWVYGDTPLTRLLVEHLLALNQQIATLSKQEARQSFLTTLELLIAAFGREAGMSGNARAAVRAAVYGQVRRHVEANLHDPDLSPESVLKSLHLSRATVYRLFEHDGGLAAYIRNRRLRAAADELVRFPHMEVQDIAAGLGFNDASSFTRAFRRAFDLVPRDLHEFAPLLKREYSERFRFA